MQRFSAGTSVRLTATPDPGYAFAGWSGPCSGLGPTCTVTVEERTSVGALFVEAAIGTTDSAGNVTLNVGGQALRLAFVDEVLGSPVRGLAVGVGSIETGVGVLLVGDPQKRYPIGIAILHGDVSGLASAAADAGEVAAQVITVVQFSAAAIEAYALPQQLPRPVQNFIEWSGALGTIATMARLIDAAGLVSVGHELHRLGLAERRLITKEDAIANVRAGLAQGALETVAILGISVYGTAGLTLPIVAPGLAFGVIVSRIGANADVDTIINCSDDDLYVVSAGIVEFYACDRSPGRGRVDGLLRVETTRPGGGPGPEQSRIHVISNDSLGEGHVAALDANGSAEISVPIGDYTFNVISPGMSVRTEQVSVPLGGTTARASLEFYTPETCPAPGWTGWNQCWTNCNAAYQQSSGTCRDGDIQCVNAAIAAYLACIDRCDVICR